ncbi:Uma2 family endonuclease [Hymenobacter chitinivorans]|uniref:Putative restriction endonuclease n=1 Tax=Hymenobacter chitinivorans DSM 11115 TaxID=1121954 RepID=A0A2M9APV8_9BACT|nr:Uma2 family endonuclease [Hymenobacter chitinivorans]PJJ47731.1 putative restriction endonuclease [Hymenobacter chitinivorans DSM 11115]
MSQTQASTRRYTVEEYQALEEVSEQRHAYCEGEVFAMSGATPRHTLIAQNCAFALRQAVRSKGWQVFLEGVQLAVQENRYYTYPDVMI